VATVDGREITREDADRRARITLRHSGVDETDPAYETKIRRAHKGAVDFLIRAYVMQDAASGEVTASSQEVAQELLTWKSKVPSKEAWDQFLASNQLSEEGFAEILSTELRVRKLMEKAAARDVPTPSPDEARRFFESNTHAFAWPYRVRYDEIRWLAPRDLPAASTEQARSGMQKLSEDLGKNPALFDQILNTPARARFEPVGFKMPYQNTKDLAKPIEQALHTLVLGEISPLIEWDLGFSIIRINSLREPYDSAYKDILESLYSDRAASNLESWMANQQKKRKVRICDVDYYKGEVASATSEEGEGK
jgi:hypothetical protein